MRHLKHRPLGPIFVALALTVAMVIPAVAQRPVEGLADDSARDERFVRMLASTVRHELITLPYYDVFDWITATVDANGGVVLEGAVADGGTKEDAEGRLEDIESVTSIENNIEVLPPSPSDDALRIALYRAIYNWDSPLFRYATSAAAPIHILVENGRATLKGWVDSEMDKQLAYTAARQVSGLFEVNNDLEVLGNE